jgi:N-dimethylarginine dimethylaminohydrolase
MKKTCHSEIGKLKSVFIKKAEDAFQNEALISDQWKDLNFLGKPDYEKAKAEYQKFESIFSANKIDIFHFEKDETVSMDSIYCRDAAIATDHGIIICNMGKAARKPEPKAQQKIFEKHSFNILGTIESPGTVEGGDVAWLDEKTLAIGHTYRTNENGIQQLKNLLTPFGIEIITVPLPHYRGPSDVFHLMSILSPVDKNLAVVYSPLMPIIFRNDLLNRGYELIEIPESEFDSMGCNVLAIAPRKCIMVKGNPITKSLLEKAGCEVFEYDGNEISVKGGGGPTCLTRPVWREIY